LLASEQAALVLCLVQRLPMRGRLLFTQRAALLAAMQANGVRIERDRGETVVHPVEATDDANAIGPGELVLFWVKLWKGAVEAVAGEAWW
jgi:hypothetical protein